jgi:YcaO-like protein with predicted kinase domain
MTSSSFFEGTGINKFAQKVFSLASKIGVTRVSEITSYDDPFVYVYQSCRPSALHLTIDSGKGYDRNQAFISCCVEAIERFSAENVCNDIHYMSLTELLPDVQRMLLLNSVDYRLPCLTCHALLDDEDRSIYIPEELIKYNSGMSARATLLLYRPGTTGLGSHSSLIPACYSGLIELLERDAINSSFEKFLVDIDSLPNCFDRHIKWIRNRYESFSIFYHFSPHPVHTFSIECNDPYLYGGLNGMGASYTLMSALDQALVESIQTSVLRISASRDDWIFASPPFGLRKFLNQAPVLPWNSLSSLFSEVYGTDFSSHLKTIKQYCKTRNFNVYYCKLYPGIDSAPIVTVKVVCPWLLPLEQANMLTGVPRFLSDLQVLNYD